MYLLNDFGILDTLDLHSGLEILNNFKVFNSFEILDHLQILDRLVILNSLKEYDQLVSNRLANLLSMKLLEL